MPPSHKTVIQKIINCRTEALGGQVYYCQECDIDHYLYHSCQSRYCPKCGNDKATQWLQKQQHLLLPVTHFMITITLPEELRPIARSNQKIIYRLFFKASSQAILKLAKDPEYIGGTPGLMGVLQTWTRDMAYHPHIHYISTGGGLSPDKTQWLPARNNFLLPAKALSIIFRAKFRDLLKKEAPELFATIPKKVWRNAWVCDVRPVGSGKAVFKYLAPYLFRVAISNHRILRLHDGRVTFSYKDRNTGNNRTSTLPVFEFIRRFLQHVLPKGFVKLRYYGIWHPKRKQQLQEIKKFLYVVQAKQVDTEITISNPSKICCPKCGNEMFLVGYLQPKRRAPPEK